MLKAKAVRAQYRDALIIGSDQVAALRRRGARQARQPRKRACASCASLSGKAVDFHTAVALLDARSGRMQSRARALPRACSATLDERRIEAYLRREQPYDCAGSAKAEGLGIALIARIETDDPTALIGLPLIALTEMLERAGLPVLP